MFVVHPALVPSFEGAMKVLGVSPAEYAKSTVLLSPAREVKGLGYPTIHSLIRKEKPMKPVSFDGEKAKTVCSSFLFLICSTPS